MTLLGSSAPAEKETLAATFNTLAPHYDVYRSAPTYPQWLAGLLELVAEHGLNGGLALDVGCGTGDSLEALIAAGFSVSGVDTSPGMLECARARLGDSVELGVATLPEPLPIGPKVDLVTAFNDVVNYIAPESLSGSMTSLAARMRSGGLLLFDANTPLLYTTYCSAPGVRDRHDSFFVWEPLSEPTDAMQVADLHAFARDPDDHDRWERSVSRHVQYLHPPEAVMAAFDDAGLELVDVRGAYDEGPLGGTPDDTQHIKRVYLARLP